jgi:hypothetical protein
MKKTLPQKFPKQFAYGKLVTLLFIQTLIATGEWELEIDYDGSFEDIVRKKDVAMRHIPTGKIVIFQVKGEKEASRSNPNLEEIFQVVEWIVEDRSHNPHDGWLHGHYERIAFLAGDKFIDMTRPDLFEYATTHRLKSPKIDKWASNNKVIPHQDYCRRSNYKKDYDHPNECINWIRLADFLSITHTEHPIPPDLLEEFREAVKKL